MSNYWVGEKVKFRAIHKDDKDFMDKWGEDTEMMRRVNIIRAPQVDNPEEHWINDAVKNYGKDDQYSWVIENHDGEIVGNVTTFRTDLRVGTFFYALSVHVDHRGKGYASEMINMMLRFMFEERGYNKCNAFVYDFNEASIKLHEKLGFTQEGRIRAMGYTNGQHVDFLYFGILASEFAKLHGTDR